MKSWRTTTTGVIIILTAVATATKQLLDGDPATNPDLLALGAQIAAGWGLITARDNKVSSEDAGIK